MVVQIFNSFFRISDSVKAIDFGALLSQQIDRILTEKFFEKLIAQKLDEKMRKFGDQIKTDHWRSLSTRRLRSPGPRPRSSAPKHSRPRSRTRNRSPESRTSRAAQRSPSPRWTSTRPYKPRNESPSSSISSGKSSRLRSSRSRSPKLPSIMWQSTRKGSQSPRPMRQRSKSPESFVKVSKSSNSIEQSQRSSRSKSPRAPGRLERRSLMPERSVWSRVYVGRLSYNCQERHLMELFG